MKNNCILCLDDEKVVLDSLRGELMRNLGSEFHFEFVTEPGEALEIIDEYDQQMLMVISDWLMPGMKGDEFLTRVHEKHPSIITVMLTGQADEVAIQRATRNANLFRCLHKPWTRNEVTGCIREAAGHPPGN